MGGAIVGRRYDAVDRRRPRLELAGRQGWRWLSVTGRIVGEDVLEIAFEALLELPELADALPDLTPDLGQTARAEDEQRDEQHHEDLCGAELHDLLLPSPTRVPGASRRSPCRASGDEEVLPVVALQQEMQIEHVVRRQGRPVRSLANLGWEAPALLARSDGCEQLADVDGRVMHDRVAAERAAEAVRRPFLGVGSHEHRHLTGPQADGAAAGTLSPDRGHGLVIGRSRARLEPRVRAQFRLVTPPITFAHRGARATHPENTITAFRHALDRGARGLETDAWVSADGEAVLVHDDLVWERRWGVIPWRVRVGRASAARLARSSIPRLVDLYTELGSDYELSIDLKDAHVAEVILAVSREHGDPERLWLCSPSTRRLRAIRELAPEVHLVHSQTRTRIENAERHAANLAESTINVMNMHHSEWTAGLVALFHRFGVQAFAWDVQEVRQMRAMLRMGIDGIYSDYVARLVSTVAEWPD